jgi:acyl-coenzyme A thioesterase PaaI-like protein
MADSFYLPDDGCDGAQCSTGGEAVSRSDATDSRWLATEATQGPWSSELQHGGPPSALLVRASERAAMRHTGRDDLQALRVVVDFLGAVPVGPVEVHAEVVRAGRSAVLVDAELAAAGRTALRSRTWLVRRTQEASAPTTPRPGPDDAPPGPDGLADDTSWDFGYARHLRWRPLTGGYHRPGPAGVWVNPRVPLVPGEPLTGLQRVVTVADSASGISAELPFDGWSFPNIDLTVHLSRPPDGQWLLLDARTQLSAGGNGLAEAVLHDRHGPVGRSAQTLVVTPLP